MGWMQKLCHVYDQCTDAIGIYVEDQPVLLPIWHTLLNAPITITLSIDGELLGVIAAQDHAGTIAPCTEKSLSRTGNALPHLLCDSLQYIAGDLAAYTDEDNTQYFQSYLAQLSAWYDSPWGCDKLRAVLTYVSKATFIKDLTQARVLFLDENGRLLEKWNGPRDQKPALFSATISEMKKVNVRFCVDDFVSEDDRLWTDPKLWESAQRFNASLYPTSELCYVSGERQPTMQYHPKKIIRRQANAKLISAKDTNLKYRGRFIDGDQALNIGVETSLKAHYALSWLAESRGLACGDQTILAFGDGGQALPDPLLNDALSLLAAAPPSASPGIAIVSANSDTMYAYMEQLNHAVHGFRYRTLKRESPVVIMALDQSTAGRLAITFYQEMRCSEYIASIGHWHESCSWILTYTNAEGKHNSCYCAPSHSRIIDAAYGKGASTSDKLRKNTYLALMSCVFNGLPVPRELIDMAVHRASNPLGLSTKEKDSLRVWNETLETACALYRKHHEKEAFPMSLDTARTDRSYLFGRLLAAADQMERYALMNGENRPTNALRLMTAFSQHPVRVWKQIDQNVRPYRMKLGKKADYYENLISEILTMFQEGDFDPRHDKPLDGLYLLGYHSQRQEFLNYIKSAKKEREEN